MPLRAGNVFYFLFNAESQKLIDATTLTALDVAYEAAPAPGKPYPQSLRLRFKLTNPGKMPQVRPLGPGQLEWLPDPGGTVPEPEQAIPAANIASWPIKGTLQLTIGDSQVAKRMAKLSGLPVVPNVLWYSKVRLTKDFLFTSLAALPRTPAPLGLGRKGSVPTDRSDWINHAVAAFLKGMYMPKLVADADPAKDSLATVAMPEVVADAGTVELVVTTASDAGNDGAFDGVDLNFEKLPGFENLTNAEFLQRRIGEPAHPRNGAIPARVVYRALRAPAAGVMVDAAAGMAIPDRTLDGDRYFPVRFTRVWQAIPDCSVHFPSQVVQAQGHPLPVIIRQRLAAHGWLWISLTQNQVAASTEFRFTVSNPSARPEREMRWLKGETKKGPPPEPPAWTKPADTVPVDYDLAAGIPHIILRRRMGQEVVYDRRQRPTAPGGACTYFSLRRSIVRALVNNRIAGGRLNFESFWPGRPPGFNQFRNKPETRRLVEAALGKKAASRVLDGRPDPRGDIGDMAISLIPVLEQFFPEEVPAQTIGNSTYRKDKFSLGRAAYAVWQSPRDDLQGNERKRNFAQNWVGGGAPGALVATKLASGYAVRAGQSFPYVPNPNRSQAQRDAVADRNVEAILTAHLPPGTVLQFWDDSRDYDQLVARNAQHDPVGHSPIFLRYDGPANAPTGIWVLDQTGKNGETLCPVTGVAPHRRLHWHGYEPDLWIAASWTE